MAGEVEDSYNFSFQADSLHSGSVSFGRFESEPLSWERRSSFSHNRYLEEVEKCSKPGSVIEKKAYFEAHFKKKGLLRPNSSEYHSGAEYQTSENDVLESREELELVNEHSHYAHFDESPESSQYRGEYEVTGCDMENPGVSSSVPQMESALNNADILIDGVAEDVNAEETYQTESGCDKFHSVNDEPEITVNHNLNRDDVNTDESSKAPVNDELWIEVTQNLDCDAVNAAKSPKGVDPSPKTGPAAKVDNTSLERLRNSSPKLKAATGSKPLKPRVKSQANVVRVQRHISGATSEAPAKNLSRRERESSPRTNIGKNSSKTDIPTTRAIHRTPILEDSTSQKAKLTHDNKSGEKGLRRKKVGESQPPLTKAESGGHLTANRLRRTANSTRADAGPAYSFNPVTHLTQFYMKLEEKMHAKDAEMNQIQARTQEKTEAEIKQFRKSLNFKATPMPSFYHVAVPPGSDGKKVVLSNNKVSKARNKSTSPGSRAAAGSKSYFKSGDDQVPSTSESVDASEPLDASEEINCPATEHSGGGEISQTANTNQSCPPEATAGNEVTGRKERGKEKDTSLHKHRVSESHKVTKGQRVDGKQKVGARKSSNEMARKDMKGIGIGSSSGMGHLAVGVAS
uniref:TPX2 C-terminal domain-containing protein n=1 Tax=Fagus sylvatica TaxID=28930 RepID=A0A2N9FZH2_FAGSY